MDADADADADADVDVDVDAGIAVSAAAWGSPLLAISLMVLSTLKVHPLPAISVLVLGPLGVAKVGERAELTLPLIACIVSAYVRLFSSARPALALGLAVVLLVPVHALPELSKATPPVLPAFPISTAAALMSIRDVEASSPLFNSGGGGRAHAASDHAGTASFD